MRYLSIVQISIVTMTAILHQGVSNVITGMKPEIMGMLTAGIRTIFLNVVRPVTDTIAKEIHVM